eukprot:624679-Pyramimonas_sp.AAC.1
MADGEDGAGSTAGGPWARALSVLPPLVYMVLSALLSVTNRYIYHDRRPAVEGNEPGATPMSSALPGTAWLRL